MSAAIFEVIDGRYVAAFLWTAAECPDGTMTDMLGMLWRDQPTDPWTFKFRCRLHADLLGPDEKRIAQTKIDSDRSEESAIETLLHVWRRSQEFALQAGFLKRVIEEPRAITVKSSRAEEVARVLLAQPFSKVTEEPN